MRAWFSMEITQRNGWIKWLKNMCFCADLASERMYGEKEVMNTDYMRKD